MVQAQEMSYVGALFESEQVIKVATPAPGFFPFFDCAIWNCALRNLLAVLVI
jgi:hypothetical protein